MKNKLKKRCMSFLLALAMLASLGTVNVQTAKAQDYTDYLYGGFAVTALSSTSVTVNYQNLYYDLEGYVTVSGWKVRVEDEFGHSQDMQTAAPNQMIYTIGGLTPGVKYTIEVRMMRTWIYLGEYDEGYALVSFVAPTAGTGAVDVVTQTPVVPTTPTTTETPYVPTTPTVDNPYTVQPSTPSVKQPQIKTSKCKIKKNSIYIKWGKVKNAKSYTIYMRKEGAKKWTKVKKVSASKTSYKITKYKGKKINLYKQDYEVTVMATAKINGKSYNSPKTKFIRTYTYYY